MERDSSWLTTEEVLDLLHISRRTWNRWLRERPVERQIAFGDTGKSYLYSREALLHLVREMRGAAVAESVASCPTAEEEGQEEAKAPPRLDETGTLALPPAGHVAEFLDLLADVRDVVARAASSEERVGQLDVRLDQLGGQLACLADENRQLREVLSAVAARLPGPPATPSPPPRLRPRVVAEVVLLGWVGLLAGVLGAVVLQRLADVGVVALPAWWPIG